MNPSRIYSWLSDLLENKPFGILAGLIAYFFTVIAVIIVVYFVGPATTGANSKDAIALLDISNRIWVGQRPYIDFHTAFGPFSFLFMSFGISLVGISMKTYWVGQMLAVFLIGSLAFYVCSKRLSLFWTILGTLNVTSILCMPIPLGMRVWRDFNYAMGYNKISFVLSGILLISLLIPLRIPSRPNRIVRGILDGVCLALLFTTKVTFFFMFLGLYLIAKLFWTQRDEDWRSETLWCCARCIY